jgi:putative dimethyl sulfoxide reductase chaperone
MQIPSEIIGRSFIYRWLAKAYEYPDRDGWQWLTDPEVQSALSHAADSVGRDFLQPHASEVLNYFRPSEFDQMVSDYIAAFGHAARGPCPLNEIEYGELKADPLIQPHRLADLAAFYRAFGMEPAPDAHERMDHICFELEFMAVLAAKEAYALEHQHNAEQLEACRQAQKDFLREHLGRWTPAFVRRLSASAGASSLGALARFTQAFIENECRRFQVTAGSEDLLLRPVDERSESLCDSCGITSLPPGALSSAATV